MSFSFISWNRLVTPQKFYFEKQNHSPLRYFPTLSTIFRRLVPFFEQKVDYNLRTLVLNILVKSLPFELYYKFFKHTNREKEKSRKTEKTWNAQRKVQWLLITVLDKFSPLPEFDLSKKLILVKAPPKETCPRKSCEIQGGGLNLSNTVRLNSTWKVKPFFQKC